MKDFLRCRAGVRWGGSSDARLASAGTAPPKLCGVKPEVHVLGLSLKSFGIVFALGFLSAGAIIARRLKELGKPVDWAYELAFASLIGGLVGSRLYYVIQNYSLVKHDLLG